MINFLKLYSAHIKSGKRVIFIASIGLICALTMVSSTNYYFDNSKKELSDEFLANPQKFGGYNSANDLEFTLTNDPPVKNNTLTNLLGLINQSSKDYGINYFKTINSYQYISGLNIPAMVNVSGSYSYTSNLSVDVFQISNKYINDLNLLINRQPYYKNMTLPEQNSTLPELFLIPLSDSNASYTLLYNKSNYINLYDCAYCSYTTANSYPVNVTGLAKVDPYNYYYNGKNSLPNPDINLYKSLVSLHQKLNLYVDCIAFVSNLNSFSSMIKPVSSSSTSQYYGEIQNIVTINFDYSKIDPLNAGTTINQINNFKQHCYDLFYNLNFDYNFFYISFPAETKFQNLTDILINLLFGLTLLSLPIIIATLFVINYSFGLIYKSIIRHIGIYKTRGATSWMIFSFQLIDNLLIIGFSTILALGTGIPFVLLSLRTDFLLSFNYSAPAYLVLNFESVVSLLVISGIILTIIVNSLRIKKFSQVIIVETEQPIDKMEPIWKKHYFDVVLFSFGITMYLLVYFLIKNPTIKNALGPVINLLVILAIPAPFALVIGLILLANRIIPFILNKIGSFLWTKTGDLIAFSFKNVIRHQQASTRAVMLIAILLTFTVFFYSLPYSDVLNHEKTLYFQNGADVLASFNNGYNETTLQIIEANFSQYLEAFSPYVILTSGNTYVSSSSSAFFLINTSTYVKSAYLHFDLGLKKSIKDDMLKLQPNNASDYTNMKAIVDSSSLANRKAHIGDNISILGVDQNLKVQVIDSFLHWPLFNYEYPSFRSITLGIGDISYYLNAMNKSLVNSPFDSVADSGILFNFKDSVNQTLIANWIEGNTSITITSLTAQMQKQYYSNAEYRLQLGQVNNDVLMIILISIIVLIMFGYLQLSERRKEIFTERALGMKLYQIALLFFIETIILSITSIVLGLSVGVFLMELLAFLVFDTIQYYPPYEIVYPINLILITTGLLLISAILISIIPAYFVTKQDISKSFGES